jgi:hypothetical protein
MALEQRASLAAADARAHMEESLRVLQAAGAQAAAHLAELRLVVRRLHQVVAGPGHGPRNHDPLDRTWQSDLCAGWLHESCPAPGACDCTCHGGTVR